MPVIKKKRLNNGAFTEFTLPPLGYSRVDDDPPHEERQRWLWFCKTANDEESKTCFPAVCFYRQLSYGEKNSEDHSCSLFHCWRSKPKPDSFKHDDDGCLLCLGVYHNHDLCKIRLATPACFHCWRGQRDEKGEITNRCECYNALCLNMSAKWAPKSGMYRDGYECDLCLGAFGRFKNRSSPMPTSWCCIPGLACASSDTKTCSGCCLAGFGFSQNTIFSPCAYANTRTGNFCSPIGYVNGDDGCCLGAKPKVEYTIVAENRVVTDDDGEERTRLYKLHTDNPYDHSWLSSDPSTLNSFLMVLSFYKEAKVYQRTFDLPMASSFTSFQIRDEVFGIVIDESEINYHRQIVESYARRDITYDQLLKQNQKQQDADAPTADTMV
ncbi:MAG: hypothetical protein CMK92_03780 [Pseudomonas sp.]|nr:hypothetical protein [Pseudomonas sp.]